MRPMMTYTLTVASPEGETNSYLCGGANDLTALIYAGKVVELHARAADPEASVVIERDGEQIGVSATVRDMRTRAV